jgi:hypothetical protein
VRTSGEEQETPSKHASMDRLCNLLRERTGEGKVQWQREESGRSIWYRTFVAGCPIHLWYAGDYPVLEVRSAYGRTLSQGRGLRLMTWPGRCAVLTSLPMPFSMTLLINWMP